MILVIDNYDSFVNNLARYFRLWGQETLVVRNDQIDIAKIRELHPAAIVLSPGPCTPEVAGISIEAVRQFVDALPILGVCLGHQAIAAALGGKIVRAPEPMHGRASLVRHDSDPIFAGLPDLLRVGRYHSLAVDRRSLPDSLRIIAAAEDRSVMAIRHVARPIYGLQFHPESILTENGLGMIGNFLQCAGIESARRSEVSTDQKQGEISPTLSPTNVPFYY